MTDDPLSPEAGAALDARAKVPQHVVYRAFAAETVLLNLETGTYHGVNPTGGRMLHELEAGQTLREAAKALEQVFDVPLVEIEADIATFCLSLEQRGLLELVRTTDSG